MTLYRLTGTLQPLVFDLHSGVNTVGRNPTNDCVIHEASVSSFHAEVDVREDGVMARDLQSTNGTFLNDEPVVEVPLRPGQVIQFGTVTFRLDAQEVRIEVPVLAAPAPAAPAVVTLPDGALACGVDPGLAATHRCLKCQRVFHASNCRSLRLSGANRLLLFCPECHGNLERIPGTGAGGRRDAGLLARLAKTIQVGFKRPS